MQHMTALQQWGADIHNILIKEILKKHGLSEKDMEEDPFYQKELAIRPYAIDTLVNLLMKKWKFQVIDEVDDYRILRGGSSYLEWLRNYHNLLIEREKTVNTTVESILQ